MASALPKLLTRSPATRIVSAFQFHKSNAPILLEPPASHPLPIFGINPECHQPANLSPGKEHSSLSTIIFPSFPFGFPLNPDSSHGCCSPESEMDNSRTIWADSVKKKRKKKMNKHKYQKLRKRMRRKT